MRSRALGAEIPTLGVCLGLQCLNEVHGGRTVRTAPVHGKVSEIVHGGRGLFAGVPSPLRVARYHSLAVEPAAAPWATTSRSPPAPTTA